MTITSQHRAQDKLAAEIAQRLQRAPAHHFLLKPRHSAFLGTPPDLALPEMGAQRLVRLGLSTDCCLQFTAMDAHLRGYALHSPGDCTATLDPRHQRASLAYMRCVLKAGTRRCGA